MDPRNFRAPFLRRTQIWERADALRDAVQLAEQAGFAEWDASGKTALGYIANHIRGRFGISPEVIAGRLRNEQLWPPK